MNTSDKASEMGGKARWPVLFAGQPLDGRHVSSLSFSAGKMLRHVQWARRDGLARLIEEDELNPVDRVRQCLVKREWRRRHGVAPGQARPVFLVGLQRSGTNMMMRGLDQAPEFEVHNENDRRTFDRYRLRPLPAIESVVKASRHCFVLFKPLCDSHRTDELLNHCFGDVAPLAVWAVRGADGRARSSVAKFGDHDRDVLMTIADDPNAKIWQAQRLSVDTLETIKRFDCAALSPESAAALYWWARNSVFFDLGLDGRDDVVVASYERFVSNPRQEMRKLCAFLGLELRDGLIDHIDDRYRRRRASALILDPNVRALCEAMEARFDSLASRQVAITR